MNVFLDYFKCSEKTFSCQVLIMEDFVKHFIEQPVAV